MALAGGSPVMPTEAASTSEQSPEGPKVHIRTYQACIPCRRRKVRCDLGPVDAPHDPPCVRCRRESKECFFSATRRKRKTADGDEDLEDEEPDDYDIRNGRKRQRGPSANDDDVGRLGPSRPGTGTEYINSAPLTPGGHAGTARPLRPGSKSASQELRVEDEENEQVNNETAARLQKGEVFGGHDALNLLATASAGLHMRSNSMSSARPSLDNINTPGSHPSLGSPHSRGNFAHAAHNASQPIDLTGLSRTNSTSHANGMETPGSDLESARRAWSRFRFVRAGWFTAEEGIQYIEYFYQHLSPLTPVILPDYHDPSRHETLLSTEPMLTVTMLTLASRYMRLTGPGSNSRPYSIHTKLWNYLQGMIDRIIWGQEHFSGGFAGNDAQSATDMDPLHRKGLRTLGTVESFIVLTEWHPRALHFPPGDDDYELMIPVDPMAVFGSANGREPGQSGSPPIQGTSQRIDHWLEPCWRSDRMCWMLLGNALSLAVEIGVFDDINLKTFVLETQQAPIREVREYLARKDHLRDLLQIYVTQTSGRLGLTSMLPSNYMAEIFRLTSEERLQDRTNKYAAIHMHPQSHAHGASVAAVRADPRAMTLHFWTELAAIMHLGNQRMFPSRRYTRELIRKGEYANLLKTFHPMLETWRQDFDACESIPRHMRYIMLIEYEYARVYLHCLALQAVVERCTHHSPPVAPAQANDGKSVSPEKDGGAIPPRVLVKWIGNDRQYISEIIEACRNVLRIVNEGLYPDDSLKHAPVRTYFRIISVAIILLKTFLLGATEDDVKVSLGLVDEAIKALRLSVVDDVHIINSFTELATILTRRIRRRFVRLSANGGSGNGKSRGVTPTSQLPRDPGTMAPPEMAHKPRNMSYSAPQQWNNGPFGNQYQYADTNKTGRQQNFSGRSGNPLHGISTESYDLSSNNFSIVPPPNFGANGSFDASQLDSFNYNGLTNDDGSIASDWLAIPLDPLIFNQGGDVTQTTYGPDVGGLDLLDVLLDPGSGQSSY